MKLYYFVENGGDGSANVRFCESKEVAEIADDNQWEGWGEPSVGYVEGKVITVPGTIVTAKELILDAEERLDDEYSYNRTEDEAMLKALKELK